MLSKLPISKLEVFAKRLGAGSAESRGVIQRLRPHAENKIMTAESTMPEGN